VRLDGRRRRVIVCLALTDGVGNGKGRGEVGRCSGFIMAATGSVLEKVRKYRISGQEDGY
jgi:hypothetical protein